MTIRDMWLTLAALALVVLILPGCATVSTRDGLNPDGSMTYTLTPDEVARCLAEGGCSTVTGEYERQLVREAAKHFCGVDI